MGPSGERAVAGVTQGEMALGDVVTWQARHFGIPFRMTSAITAYDLPLRFVLRAYMRRLIEQRNRWLARELRGSVDG